MKDASAEPTVLPYILCLMIRMLVTHHSLVIERTNLQFHHLLATMTIHKQLEQQTVPSGGEMMSAQPQPRMTLAEYLDFEETSLTKHEYYAGQIFALAGGNESHSIISSNINASLHTQLQQRPCIVYTSDMKIKIERTKLYTYPDVSIVCGQAQFEDTSRRVLLNPIVIIEVLSDSTEKYDRGKKFQNYRTIDTLQEYILVAQDAKQVDQYVRQPDNLWLLSSANAENEFISLPSINCTLHIQDIYAKVTFETTTEEDNDQADVD